MTATPQQRLVSMKATMEHALELANGGRQQQAEKLLTDFLSDDGPYPPHATVCGTCKAKAKVPMHSSGHGVACLNCGMPS